MVTNLRILSVESVSNVLIKVTFTDPLSPTIKTDNVTINSQTPGVPSPIPLEVRIINNVLEIKTQPLTPLAAYFIIFNSTDSITFKSLNGNAILFEDGIANKQFFTGPIESTNIVKEYFLSYLRDNVYNLEEGTILVDYLNTLSTIFSTALYDVRQARNENYLSINIIDERKIRGATAFDHLDEEGAYEIIRIGKTPTDAISNMSITVEEFNEDPISLLQSGFDEELTINSTDRPGSFNINTFVLNLSKKPVIKLTSLIFTYTDGHLPFTYDITKFGYQILDSKYDSEFAFTYFQLSNNQIKLSDKILEDSDFSSNNIFKIQTAYEYKDTGRTINQDSVSVTSVFNSIREVLPPLKNIFNLKHGPIVTANDNIGTVGDIQFIDQNSLPALQAKHPAFLNELKFRFDFLPSAAGEYSIDYSTGTVYVFGASTIGDGTGAVPPLASYKYRISYKEDIDWVIEPSYNDLAALPTGSLIDAEANISFDFEQVLAQDIAYKAQIHQEVLGERINNNLVSLNTLSVVNPPITNVFRIFNETSGEIYKLIRWSNDKIFFTYNVPPNIEEVLGERISFESINNEVLFVNNTIENVSLTTKIFKVLLNNNNIIAQSEDCIGSSFNSTVSFSDNVIFARELYFDTLQSEETNLLRLTTIGNYFIDYTNGIVYVIVTIGQDFNLGTISYKRGYIKTHNPHITSVEDIYYRINTLSSKEKHFDYIEFNDGFILPENFDTSDEQLLSSNIDSPYVVLNNAIGAFVDSNFAHTVTNSIQFIRHIYENDDLLNNYAPINFAETATFNDKSISITPLEKKEYHSVEYDGSDYFVILNTGLQYLSPNITLNIEVLRLLDLQNLWDVNSSVVEGDLIKLILSGVNSPQIGDSVLVTYTYSINDLSHVIVDYNKGEYYSDYSALMDEIIVSYEYGNNAIDFRESDALSAGETYFVSYKVGALRDALFKNFGSLIDIDILNVFDVTFSRERYRDALMAAMHSFSQGPTVNAIKNIAETISHLPAEVNESVFDVWSLGHNLLSPHEFEISGDTFVEPTKYNNGLIINESNQSVTLPIVSNLKLEEGTFETWINPDWNGIDNLADLKIIPFKDGYLLSELEIFIGALEYHPTYEIDVNGSKYFTLNKNARVEGIPNRNKDGVYFYYDNDITNTFKRWFVEIIDGYANDGYAYDGYVSKKYTINISTNGKFYDLKSTINPKPSSSRITSGNNNVSFVVESIFPNEGITFVADIPHYILDFGEKDNKNRFSVFKDESGYLVFKIFDNLYNPYVISKDVSNWRHGELHHIATSWKINNKIGRDELHLFIDGFEVPNIIRYGSRITPYLHEKFRTINPEEIVDKIDKNIISGDDLEILSGSSQVTSSINFSQYNIFINDTIYIEESGFNTSGYTIINVNGNTLTLNTILPFTINNAKFVVNKTSFDIGTEVDIFPNFMVSLIHSYLSSNDLSTIDGYNVVTTSSTNLLDSDVLVGDLIRVNDVDFEKYYTILSVSSNSLTLNDNMPLTASGLSFNLYHNLEEEIPGVRALHPAYEITKSTDGYFTNILTIRDKALVDDLILIKTLGINHRRVKRKYYVWGNTNNILKTKLPSPISLDEVKFNKVLLNNMFIGPSNSTLTLGIFHSNNILVDPISNVITGRTLFVSVQGDNVDFSTPTTVDITGDTVDNLGNIVPIVETLTFTQPGRQYTTNLFAEVSYINVHCKPFNTLVNCAVVEMGEKYSIVTSENVDFIDSSPTIIPQAIVRYSYQVGAGNTLSGDSTTVTDDNHFFSNSLIGNYLNIYYPPSVAGMYIISDISDDHHSLVLDSAITGTLPLASFTDGYYQILNPTDYRSGLQNGYFTFEQSVLPGTPFYLTQGWYELDYYTYLQIPFEIGTNNIYIGSDYQGNNQLYGNIDELQILNIKLTDTRIGETAAKSQRTVTKEFNSVKASKSDINSLVLTHFDTLPPINEANIYRYADRNIIQSGNVINDNFTQSIAFINKPIIVDNLGILDVKKEGTIEFWINPIFDTQNDPNYRFYFDAFGAVTEELTSTNNITIKLLGTASQILNVNQKYDTQNINYFAGGNLSNGGKTLNLHKELPNQNTNVLVTYIPKGLKGDRISIFKDLVGYLNFNIRANEIDYMIRAPILWSRDTWHRVKATYKINGKKSLDEIHLFIDGYERGDELFGSGLLFGQGLVYGSSFSGPNTLRYNIKFNDPINQFVIGGDYNSNSLSYCLMDNLRISNIARPLYQPFGEPIDPNYSSNLDMVFPITEDLNTTLLLNFQNLVTKNSDFANLNDRNSGLADFSVNILDSFGIINNNTKVKDILETLIKSFKPAPSRAHINYI